MVVDTAVAGALWSVLTRRPVNVRFFTSIEGIRGVLEQLRGSTLPIPTWWERIRALRDESMRVIELIVVVADRCSCASR